MVFNKKMDRYIVVFIFNGVGYSLNLFFSISCLDMDKG